MNGFAASLIGYVLAGAAGCPDCPQIDRGSTVRTHLELAFVQCSLNRTDLLISEICVFFLRWHWRRRLLCDISSNSKKGW